MSTIGSVGTLGTDPNYGALGVQHDPRLLMAQKLMDVGAMPTNNSTKSSFWANLLAQGARGGLGGYLYGDVQADREKERVAQEAEAKTFREMMERGPPGGRSGGTGTAPALGTGAAPPRPQTATGGATEPLGRGVLPPEQQQAIVTAATQGTMVPPDLANAVITQESGWKPGARGKGSDTGLGQVTSSTAADPGYGLPPLSDADRLDPAKNAAWSMRYLEARGKAAGLTRPEDWQNPAKVALALKAYNGGGDPNYVANVTRHLRTSDASPPPGSNMEALLSGVDAAKPRNMQLAERVALGGVSPNEPFGRGNTATDSPTPILSAPVVPVASAALQGAPGPQPPSADVPQPSPTEGVSVPPAATAPPPGLTPPVPAPALPGADDPYVNQADVPRPSGSVGPPAPAQANALPPSPMAAADPATLASFNGAPAPDAATVPQPEPAAVPQPDAATVPAAQPSAETAPAGSGETGGQPTVLPQEEPPLPVPPVPPRPSGSVGPGLLARRLQQSAPAPDNATEALNTASLAAARRGENFAPGAGPNGQQLAAPLTWAGNLGADGAPLLTPQPNGSLGGPAGPTGPQLAAPLLPPGAAPPVTPTSGPGDPGGDPGATGGQSKAPQAPAQPAPQAQPDGSSGRDAQAQADWYLSMARQAAGSSNPKIRAQAGVLEAQGQALQRRIDRQDVLDQQLGARREAREIAREDRQARAGESAADRAERHDEARTRIGIEQERLNLEQQRADPKTLDAAEQRKEDHALALKGLRWQPGSNRTVQEQIPNTTPPGPADLGNTEDGRANNTYRELYPVMARGKPTDQQRADYEAARTVLLKPKNQMSQSGQTIETPGRLPDLTKIYGPVPNEAPVPTEQALPQGAYRTGSGSIVYPGPQQPVPEKVTAEMLTNVNGLRQVQTAAESLRKNPDAVGPIAGAFPEVRAWFDPSGVPTQAMIAAIKSVKVHEISGAAVTASEEPRLNQWIPGLRDTKEVALAKLDRFATEYGNILRDKYEVYGPDTNHQANPVVERALLASPMEYTGDKAYDHMKSGQVYRAPDGQLRTKQ